MPSPSPLHQLSDMTFSFPLHPDNGRIGLDFFPTSLAAKLVRPVGEFYPPPESFNPTKFNPRAITTLAQVKILGDPSPGGHTSGHSMRNSPSNERFLYQGQTKSTIDGVTTVVTTLKSAEGYRLEHRLSLHDGEAGVESVTEFFNDSNAPVTLEMLSSFSVGGISPFVEDDAPGHLMVHRFRTGWAAEGRLDSQSLEALHLEPPWIDAATNTERFGQVGSMPVRKWFPFVALEDTQTGVVWAAQLGWAGSWQMEISRKYDNVAFSGGHADREFGHWMKKVAPGESLLSPPAYLTCVAGTLMEACERLTALQERAVERHPKIESDLPIVFNEWCTTWGDPTHDKIVAIADRLKGTPVRYLTIDAGWYKPDEGTWWNSQGDWNPNPKLFPHGLDATANAIRERGLIPGLWFEAETCGEATVAATQTDHLLKRDGHTVISATRRFWNLNDPWAIEYLNEKVIGLLKKGHFGYLKVDYNETIGLGSDHPDSLGEGLRQQTLGTYRLFERIRERLPDLVIENCSSGGYRLEPSMLGRSAMSSFSDAHEINEIPIIAANLHHLALPRQLQIWAVLHARDSRQRLAYSLAATFLGRMCLSGEVHDLTPAHWEFVLEAQHLYQSVAPMIKHGSSRLFREIKESWRHPEGWQALRRVAKDDRSLLIVVHAFAKAPSSVCVPLPEGSWRIARDWSDATPGTSIEGNRLIAKVANDFSARVIVCERA
jgi:alpha-galactosidase